MRTDSLLFLEYQDDTDMDSAMVKASTAVNQLGDALPDMRPRRR